MPLVFTLAPSDENETVATVPAGLPDEPAGPPERRPQVPETPDIKAIAAQIAEGVEEINAYLTETGREKPPSGVTTYTVEQDREWTWIKFDGRPTNAILIALHDKLDARWSKKYQAWYVHRLLSQDEVAAALDA